MKTMRKLILSICLVCCMTALQAQEAVTSSGGGASGTGGTMVYTIGQVCNETFTGNNGAITQGVQQPYEFFSFGIPENLSGSFVCSIHPNPTNDKIELEINNFKPGNFHYVLYDMEGKTILDNEISSEKTSFSMKDFKPSSYILKVILDKKDISIFKIIKN